MSYHVLITTKAEDSINDYTLYIAQDSLDRALAWQDRLLVQLREIGDMPRAYPVSEPDTKLAGYEVRKMVFGNYLAFYRIDDEAKIVYVEAFSHGARQHPGQH